ncbi:hypothetical protein [Streptomyces sp. bgisy031]|uniref:hypothetical protein n=1 Tax=Streptomyces sp. bgisy031 TaxID=3413772 RepID=UPI003D745EA1
MTCYDNRATLWSAATTADARSVTVEGVDKRLVSTVKRSDGATRITLAGRPLHRYARDAEPTQAYGQGRDGTGFAALPHRRRAQGGAGPGSNGYRPPRTRASTAP